MYQLNPVNDFYFRNAQPQYNFPPRPQMPQVFSYFVTSVDEAKAAIVDGCAINLFLDTSNGKIYLKKMGNNGISDFLVYNAEGGQKKNTVEERLANIEKIIGGQNDKPVSNDWKPAGASVPAVAEQNGHNDEAEPASLSKNAGNDLWQIRN